MHDSSAMPSCSATKPIAVAGTSVGSAKNRPSIRTVPHCTANSASAWQDTSVPATFVFVHGSNGNSFSWAPLQRELALLGHRTLAVDLPGHGFAAAFRVSYQAPQDLAALATAPAALAGVTLADEVEHVAAIVQRSAEHGRVILVGHSRGGLPLTAVGNAIPDLIDRLVYISAWCCVDLTPAEYMQTPENATSELSKTGAVLVGDPGELGVLRMNWRTADPQLLGTLKTALLADGTDEEFLAYLNTLEPEESLDVGSSVHPTHGGQVHPDRAAGPLYQRSRRAHRIQPV